ncbi:nuclear transport factor 2 family protein [Chitinilyticum litopenaei]|uniref:nuclear transport factor 2 family protein n=1 Tax=Chitinilyticum litopenaei TaxID=1121276 RepID=UPI00040024FA|nr:nuclear transport factor 2 family protein [Chitinilyticum litopenaei]
MNTMPADDAVLQAGLERVLAAYARLSPETLDELLACYAPDARFRDPFNDVRGHFAIAAIFRHMFASTGSPRFDIERHWRDGSDAFALWRFHVVVAGKALVIDGGSRLRLAADGRVCEHVDYWDAAGGLYAHLPVIGPLMGWLAARMR